MKFAEGDLAFHERPAAAIAIGGVHNRSPYTRFSSSGGGSLPGYTQGDYTVSQGMVELDLQYMGISLQSEAHLKHIHDHELSDDSLLGGVYAQAGWLPGGLVTPIPRSLEVAYRFAVVDPNLDAGGDLLFEHTAGLGWYFSGHRNKLQADATWFEAHDPNARDTEFRARLQWEISL